MKRYGFIYLTKNIINGKIYVGQKRYEKNNGIADPIKSYIGSGAYLKNAIKKYGKDNFERVILCWCYNQKGMDDMEMFFIKHFNSMCSDVGYNLVSGGQTLMPKEILCQYGDDNPNFGNKWTDEQKQAMQEIAINRGMSGENNPNFGNKWSEDQRLHLSRKIKESGAYKGANNPRATKVLCVEDGIVFDMISDVAKHTGYALSTVSICISKGKKIKGKTYIKQQ